ncbi:MAG: hypothetical protein ACRDYZ_07845, partial [Acidimicrobiales bacterium]
MARRQTTHGSTAMAGPRWRRPPAAALAAALVLTLAALSAWQGTLTRQSPAGHWATGAVVALAVVGVAAAGRARQRERSLDWLARAAHAVTGWRVQPPVAVVGVAGWAAITLIAVGWDLYSFAHESRALPTLSAFLGDVTAVPAGRGLLFAAWLALGAGVVLGVVEQVLLASYPSGGIVDAVLFVVILAAL